MFKKPVPDELLQYAERALEVAAMELQFWSGRWAYWPEDDPSFAREIAEFPTIAHCLRSLGALQHSPDRRTLHTAAVALSHARRAMAAIDGEAFVAEEDGSDRERYIDVEPVLRIIDDALLALRSEGIRATPSSSPPVGGPGEA